MRGWFFLTGLADDFKRLGPGIKFVFQVAGASLAYLGEARVSLFHFGNWAVGGALDYGFTVIWFVLLINAVNLIDGLDGLASGVVFFACAMMVILSTIGERYLSAMLFAALGGSALGFLRYNFNPASVFMGDGGSYFLGYAVAAISVLESTKAQMGAALLIPVLGLGVPIFDTMLSPLRRFVRGKKMFMPDQGHVHHRLMRMGLNHRRIVLTLYGIQHFSLSGRFVRREHQRRASRAFHAGHGGRMRFLHPQARLFRVLGVGQNLRVVPGHFRRGRFQQGTAELSEHTAGHRSFEELGCDVGKRLSGVGKTSVRFRGDEASRL